MVNFTRAIRLVRMRFDADRPPAPLGCRWCGHSPYAHDDRCLPHRPRHDYDRPTHAQFRARLAEWWRLGFARRMSSAAPVGPPGRTLSSDAFPRGASGQGLHSRFEEMAIAGSTGPSGRGRPPDGSLPARYREPYPHERHVRRAA